MCNVISKYKKIPQRRCGNSNIHNICHVQFLILNFAKADVYMINSNVNGPQRNFNWFNVLTLSRTVCRYLKQINDECEISIGICVRTSDARDIRENGKPLPQGRSFALAPRSYGHTPKYVTKLSLSDINLNITLQT